uniref:Orphan protein n=1 Tax=Rheinheimera sp. BAL341 TaxID=1708203 RepID=A0A486XLM9_9GAMM
MFNKTFLVFVILLLLTLNVAAQSKLFGPAKYQSEDFSYYQRFHWSKPVERKILYEAIANGQNHMLNKMQTCSGKTSDLTTWFDAFKLGADEVLNTEIDKGLRDGFEEHILHIFPEDGMQVAHWLVRNYAEEHYRAYTGGNLKDLKDKFWLYCLEKLPVKLFTEAAQRRANQHPDDPIPWQEFVREGEENL